MDKKQCPHLATIRQLEAIRASILAAPAQPGYDPERRARLQAIDDAIAEAWNERRRWLATHDSSDRRRRDADRHNRRRCC